MTYLFSCVGCVPGYGRRGYGCGCPGGLCHSGRCGGGSGRLSSGSVQCGGVRVAGVHLVLVLHPYFTIMAERGAVLPCTGFKSVVSSSGMAQEYTV